MIIIGHRGARGLAPENTLASFDKAVASHAAFVEFDIRLTKDKQLVVIHDRSTKRIAFIKHHIRELTLAEVKALATRDGIPIPTLEEILQHLHGKIKLNIEIKTRGIAQPLVTALEPFLRQKKYTLDDIIISSFHLGEILKVRQLHSSLRIALLQRRFPLRFLLVKRGVLYGVGTQHRLLLPWFIKIAQARGLFTYCYTVNAPARVARLQKWGIDGLCTDRPDLFVQK
ncbi:MAG TPA: glycerophosphodiester phosphodiesterase [Candidatus Saccharimonadales bacterium]|nr:glycerophosphodiester phosphodiesterase [Candidatus Saccharimonadales bacterium]